MKSVHRKGIVFSLAIGFAFSIVSSSTATCDVLIADERVQLADHALEVRLAEARLSAFEDIYALIDGLWQREAIERMVWLEAKYERDAARVALERAGLVLERQEFLVERLAATCRGAKGSAEARRGYRALQCAQLERAIAEAGIDLEFQREWLASVQRLREGSAATATAQDVIRARLEVSLCEIRLEDARKRQASCKESSVSRE
ncbi:hypothetical protein ABI59_18220 [Acidobacteria bacterium Mor1]|nr:hypothetical protein ABI59_18220 [Acidobacteria bacterium Mor1]